MRNAQIKRKTLETDISIELNLDGTGKADIETGIKFFDHMMILLAKHANIDLTLKGKGDLAHHLIEDIGISLGLAFENALGNKKGIERYGEATVPMDETLVQCALDFSGRIATVINIPFTGEYIEDLSCEDILHFLISFAQNAKMNLHIRVIYGENDHHKCEGAFKSMARAIKKAIAITGQEIPSTKGTLS
jgi:imidazoleglycerol phosphate dehydratase HisB